MPPRVFAACLSFHQVQNRQHLKSYFPGVISSQPSPRLGMVIALPPAARLEKDLLEDAERLRGGGLGCACCGSGDVQSSPLEPQPPQPPPAQSQSDSPQTTQTVRKEQPTKPPGGRVPRLSEPTPPSHAARARMVSTTPVSAQPSLAPPRAETGRAHSSPAPPSTLPSTTSHPNTRGRYTTLPSKLQPAQRVSASSPGSPTVLEGPIHYPGGIIRSPAFPPSVPAGAGRIADGGPPAAQAPFMKD
ncbi:unnamed protein product [Rhizoctonia solani]|uniref:Uncharacterized protein n=1 Tax=Rhizoctonia solani TaxID=456999 RepID=A0A8H3HUG2_9AGAM|nr:unnamed protein product [Rhizoctonia solani]